MTNKSRPGACLYFFLFFFRHFLLPHPTFRTVLNPTPSSLRLVPPAVTRSKKKRQNFSIFLNPFVRGLQVISPLTPDIILAPLAEVGGVECEGDGGVG